MTWLFYVIYNIYTCSGNTMSAEEEKKNVYQLVYHSHWVSHRGSATFAAGGWSVIRNGGA